MSFFSKKVKIILVLIISILILITLSFLTYNYFLSSTAKFSRNIKSEAKLYKTEISPEAISQQLKIFNSPFSSEEEKYYALSLIAVYFSDAYSSTNDPKIREFSKTIEKFALIKFPKLHLEGAFVFACIDASCEEKIPQEIKELMNDVNNLPIEDVWKNSINFNIKTASQIPYDTSMNKQYKLNSYTLALTQLLSLNNSRASDSAEKIRKFVKTKYNEEI